MPRPADRWRVSGECLDGLQYGSDGAAVRLAQTALLAAGFDVAADGRYGRATENAVRDFQRRHGLLPDGIVGQRTATLLGLDGPPAASAQAPLVDLTERLGASVAASAAVALSSPAVPGCKQACRGLTTSEHGLAFILAEECSAGSGDVSWPRGHSGVTIGAGYDMKCRDMARIAADMRDIGLSAEAARTMSTAAGKGEAHGGARTWVSEHAGWPGLSTEQQMNLLRLVVPQYEAVVHQHVQADLWQYQFDALVSVAYDPARSMIGLGRLVDDGRTADAAADILSRVGASADVAGGLRARREREVALFLYGQYGRATPAAQDIQLVSGRD